VAPVEAVSDGSAMKVGEFEEMFNRCSELFGEFRLLSNSYVSTGEVEHWRWEQVNFNLDEALALVRLSVIQMNA
jgi:hypothetical protein